MRIRASIAATLFLLSMFCLRGSTFAQDNPTLAATGSSTLSGGSRWTTSCIYCPKRFDTPGDHYLQIDAQGRAHLVYGGDSLYYAYQDAGGWHTETVDPAHGVGATAALALDPAGAPAIAYRDTVNGDLKYATRQPGGWLLETIDAADDAGAGAALAIDTTGRSHVAYYGHLDADSGSGAEVRYAYRDGAGWHTTDVGPAIGSGQVSLALSATGAPHLAYVDDTASVDYVRFENGAWQHSIVETAGLDADISLALDAGGQPHLLYHAWREGIMGPVLVYAHADDVGWVIELVEHGRRLTSVALALDQSGQPHFVGENPYTERVDVGLPPLDPYAWYGWREADGWRFDAIEADGTSPDLAFAADGTMRVAYFHVDRTLELAEPGPLGGWRSETADREEVLSGRIPLAVDGAGSPQVAYEGDGVYHARLTPDGWQPELIFGAKASPQSIAIDSLGQPHLAVTESWGPPRWMPGGPESRFWYAHFEEGAWQRTVVSDAASYWPVVAVDTTDRVHMAWVYAHRESMNAVVYHLLDGKLRIYP